MLTQWKRNFKRPSGRWVSWRLRKQLTIGTDYMKRHLLVGVAVLVLTAGPVLAGEIDWTGFYVGLNTGYNFGHSDASYADSELSPFSIDSHPSGWSGGLQLGVNYQLKNRIVFGIEAEASLVDASDTIYDSMSHEFRGRPSNDTIKTSSDYAGTVRARLGYAVGRFLPYLTAGVAGANAKVSATDGQLSESHFLVGWTVGAGIEYALTRNWSVKAEYLHVDLGRHTWFAGDFWQSSSTSTSETIRFGVNYKF
jgi:outer membrane immunogenic protein